MSDRIEVRVGRDRVRWLLDKVRGRPHLRLASDPSRRRRRPVGGLAPLSEMPPAYEDVTLVFDRGALVRAHPAAGLCKGGLVVVDIPVGRLAAIVGAIHGRLRYSVQTYVKGPRDE